MKKLALLLAVLLCTAFLLACDDDNGSNGNDTTAPGNGNDETAPAATSATVGETLERDGIQFTFDRIERYVDESDFAMDVAADGYEFVLLWFAVNNTTDEDYVSMSDMAYEGMVDGVAVTPSTLFFGVDGEMFGGTLNAGESYVGFVGLEVPEGWQEIEFRYNDLLDLTGNAQPLVFTATSGDLS